MYSYCFFIGKYIFGYASLHDRFFVFTKIRIRRYSKLDRIQFCGILCEKKNGEGEESGVDDRKFAELRWGKKKIKEISSEGKLIPAGECNRIGVSRLR